MLKSFFVFLILFSFDVGRADSGILNWLWNRFGFTAEERMQKAIVEANPLLGRLRPEEINAVLALDDTVKNRPKLLLWLSEYRGSRDQELVAALKLEQLFYENAQKGILAQQLISIPELKPYVSMYEALRKKGWKVLTSVHLPDSINARDKTITLQASLNLRPLPVVLVELILTADDYERRMASPRQHPLNNNHLNFLAILEARIQSLQTYQELISSLPMYRRKSLELLSFMEERNRRAHLADTINRKFHFLPHELTNLIYHPEVFSQEKVSKSSVTDLKLHQLSEATLEQMTPSILQNRPVYFPDQEQREYDLAVAHYVRSYLPHVSENEIKALISYVLNPLIAIDPFKEQLNLKNSQRIIFSPYSNLMFALEVIFPAYDRMHGTQHTFDVGVEIIEQFNPEDVRFEERLFAAVAKAAVTPAKAGLFMVDVSNMPSGGRIQFIHNISTDSILIAMIDLAAEDPSHNVANTRQSVRELVDARLAFLAEESQSLTNIREFNQRRSLDLIDHAILYFSTVSDFPNKKYFEDIKMKVLSNPDESLVQENISCRKLFDEDTP